MLKEHGGIVLDLNVTVIQPFYDLLENSLVVGRNNGILGTSERKFNKCICNIYIYIIAV